MAAAEQLATDGVDAEVIDLRCLIPLDARTVLGSVARTSRLVVVEENPYQGGWGGTVASIVAEEASTTSTPPSAGSPAPASPPLRRQPGAGRHPHRRAGRDRVREVMDAG